MGYRIFAVAVVAFWLVMTGLLIRTRIRPESVPAWLRVPPEHVLNLMFRQQEDSELLILEGGRRRGSLYLMPRRDEDGTRRMAFNGELFLRLPGAGKTQRILYDGRMALGEGYAVRTFQGRVSLRDPAVTASVDIDPAAGRYRYEVVESGETVAEGEGSFAELLKDPRIQSFGLGVIPVEQLRAAGADVAIEAHPSELRARGERIETYQVRIRHGAGGPWVFHVSPTGRVLRIDTPVGYVLAAEGLEVEKPGPTEP
jgi:hypothetical protein